MADCKDCCIVTNPLPSRNSIGLSVTATIGRSLVLRTIGQFNSIYHGDNVVATSMALETGKSFSIPTGTSVLFITADGPLQVVFADAQSVTQTVSMNSLLILDSSSTSVTITNPTTGTATDGTVNLTAVYEPLTV